MRAELKHALKKERPIKGRKRKRTSGMGWEGGAGEAYRGGSTKYQKEMN